MSRELQDAYNALRHELNDKIGKRDLLNIQIMQLEKNMKGLYSLIKRDRIANIRGQLNLGISDAIRTVMRMAGEVLDAPKVKERLEIYGFDLSRFKNPSAVIHNTLARMKDQGEIVPVVNASGQMVGYVLNQRTSDFDDFKMTLGTPNPTNTHGKK